MPFRTRQARPLCPPLTAEADRQLTIGESGGESRSWESITIVEETEEPQVVGVLQECAGVEDPLCKRSGRGIAVIGRWLAC